MPRRRWEDYFRTDLKEVAVITWNWDLVRDRDCWRALVDAPLDPSREPVI